MSTCISTRTSLKHKAHRSWRRLALGVLGLVCTSLGTPASAEKAAPSVYVVEITETIERGLAAFLERALDTAEERDAAAMVLRTNTPGGRVDAALAMKDALVGSDVPTYAFVDRQAYSAGALIALAANEIWMAPGAVMGAATPVTGGGEKASEKMVSAVRSAFAATAELRGRDPKLAQAMVDEDIEVEGLAEKGKLLTLTTQEALEHGYAEGTARSVEALLQAKGLANAEVNRLEPSVAEKIARFFTNPVVAPILMSLGMLGLLFEIKTAGWGVGGSVALLSLALFFWGHMLAGLAGVEPLVLLLAGLVLIGLEAFVIPGFGVAGVLGFLALLGGFFWAVAGDLSFATPETLIEATAMVSIAVLLLAVGAWAMFTFMPGVTRFGGLVLQSRLEREERSTPQAEPETRQSLVGARGTALTDLRPAGMARFDGKRVDVVTSGEYVAKGTPVRVTEDAGYRRVVEEVADRDPTSDSA